MFGHNYIYGDEEDNFDRLLLAQEEEQRLYWDSIREEILDEEDLS